MSFHDLPRRRSIRLQDYSYTAGAYFLTVCSFGRECTFGRIEDARTALSPIGIVVRDEWFRSLAVRKELELDAFVIMPNHLHGIVIIHADKDEAGARRAPLRLGRKKRALGSFVAGFKAAVTARVRKEHGHVGPVWQRNYYEHVIRGYKDLENHREYIAGNAARWEEDENYRPG